MSIKFKVKWNGDKWQEKFNAGAERNMDAAAVALQGYIIDKVSEGQPASAPGEPPHVLTGHLRRNIAWERVSRFVRKVGVGIGGKEKVGYALVLEYGSGPYTIKPKNGKFLAWPIKFGSTQGGWSGYMSKKTGKPTKSKKSALFAFAKEVNHPGIAARPYLRPGLYEMTTELIRLMLKPIKI